MDRTLVSKPQATHCFRCLNLSGTSQACLWCDLFRKCPDRLAGIVRKETFGTEDNQCHH